MPARFTAQSWMVVLPENSSRALRWVGRIVGLTAAGGLATVWLWPELPLVFRLMFSLAILGAVAVVGVIVLAMLLRGRARWVTILVGLTVFAAGGWGAYLATADPPAPPPPPDVVPLAAAEWVCDREVRPLPHIAPGTVVGGGPPDGWTHLIFKIKPRCRPGEGVPAAIARPTNLFFLATAARVGRATGDARYRLEAVATGVGAEVSGGDRISSSRETSLPPELSGWTVTPALKALEKDTAPAAVVARTPNLWIVDTPVRICHDGPHRPVTRRYALWADPKSGQMTTLCWEFESGARAAETAPVFLLPPALSEELPLVPNPRAVGFEALFSLGRRPTSTEYLLPTAWRLALNEAAIAESTVRLLEDELTRRAAS